MIHRAQTRRPIILLGLGFLFLAASMASAIGMTLLQDNARGWVQHTLEVENRLNNVSRLILQAETGQRGYLLTGQEGYVRPYRQAVDELPTALTALRNATRDSAIQQEAIKRLNAVVPERLAILAESVDLVDQGKTVEAIEVVRSGRGQQLMNQLRGTIGEMFREEERLLAERTANAERWTFMARGLLGASLLFALFLSVVAILDALRRFRALEGTIQELGEESVARDAAQGQVRQLQKMEAIGQLTGGIAHDFNNMLAIIIGSLDLARRRLGEDKGNAKAYLDSAEEGANRAASLTGQLLAFARRQPLEPQALEPNKLVGNMSGLLRRTLGEQIQIETVLAGGLWQIHADSEQLQSALLNLAVNARDAMPDGGKLTIETSNSELDERYAAEHSEVTAGQYVMISVTDTGTGMTPEIMEQVFEPFFTTKDVGRGTGLGLSQVFGFVKQSSGHVKLYSEVGRGTTVKLYLPRHVGDAPAKSVVVTSGGVPQGSSEELILVVEDEALVRQMSVDTLTDLGYSVIEAADGQQALEQLGRNPKVNLLFTDIVMPGMTGRVLADRATADKPSLKVLYTTGYTRNAIVHNGVVDYGVAFLQKPFTVAALARKVREVLDEA